MFPSLSTTPSHFSEGERWTSLICRLSAQCRPTEQEYGDTNKQKTNKTTNKTNKQNSKQTSKQKQMWNFSTWYSYVYLPLRSGVSRIVRGVDPSLLSGGVERLVAWTKGERERREENTYNSVKRTAKYPCVQKLIVGDQWSTRWAFLTIFLWDGMPRAVSCKLNIIRRTFLTNLHKQAIK